MLAAGPFVGSALGLRFFLVFFDVRDEGSESELRVAAVGAAGDVRLLPPPSPSGLCDVGAAADEDEDDEDEGPLALSRLHSSL